MCWVGCGWVGGQKSGVVTVVPAPRHLPGGHRERYARIEAIMVRVLLAMALVIVALVLEILIAVRTVTVMLAQETLKALVIVNPNLRL